MVIDVDVITFINAIAQTFLINVGQTFFVEVLPWRWPRFGKGPRAQSGALRGIGSLAAMPFGAIHTNSLNSWYI